MGEPLLEVHDVSKRFCRSLRRSLGYGLADVAAELMPWRTRPRTLRREEFWALDGVSFALDRGEALAIVGHNGAGKSTLLRMIAGILRPDAGDVRIAGTMQSVIELGSGFNPLLSGRENAALALSWRGVRGRHIAAAIEAVDDFAGLGTLIDAPLQSFSSGMRARLAFALAIQVRCDLLLLDEVLAVGDHDFQRKCLREIRAHLDRGGALLFVSHNIFQIQTVCQRGLMLDRGRVAFSGSAVEAMDRMFDAHPDQASAPPGELDPAVAHVLGVTVTGPGGEPVTTGCAVEIRMTLVMPAPTVAICVVSLWTRDQSVCISILYRPDAVMLPAGISEQVCIVPDLPLIAGSYLVAVAVVDPQTLHPFAFTGRSTPATPLTVTSPPDRATVVRRNAGQLVDIPGHWLESRQA